MLNPIVQRELTAVLRQKRTIALQCSVAAAFALMIALRWPTEPRMALSGSRSQEVFRLFAYGLLAAVLLLLPVFPATNIVREKKLTNIRAAGKDENIIISTPRKITLESAIEFIDEDELIEVTPNAIRLRKKQLRAALRPKRSMREDEED